MSSLTTTPGKLKIYSGLSFSSQYPNWQKRNDEGKPLIAKISFSRPGAASKQLPPLKGKGRTGEQLQQQQQQNRDSGEGGGGGGRGELELMRGGAGEEGRGREVKRRSRGEGGRRSRGRSEEQDLASR